MGMGKGTMFVIDGYIGRNSVHSLPLSRSLSRSLALSLEDCVSVQVKMDRQVGLGRARGSSQMSNPHQLLLVFEEI